MRDRSANILLVIGSTILCFLLLEAILRIAGYNPLGDLLNGRELILRKSENPTMRYELTPNSRGVAWNAPVAINSHGFRDYEYDLVKPDGVYRIGIIGDSITFGNSLELEETYSKRLEKLFEQHGAAVEVLNLGVGGYDSAQEVALLEKIGLQFDLDEVIVGYCMNDTGVVSGNLKYIERASTYGSPIYNSRALQLLRLYLDRLGFRFRSLDYGFAANPERKEGVENEIDTYVKERMRRIGDFTSANDDHVSNLAWYADSRRVGKVLNAFDRLQAMRDRHRFKVSVLIIPYISNHIEAHGWAYEIIRHEAERRGFHVIEVLEKFVEAGVSNLQTGPRDRIHPNAVGHRIIGESLFELFRQNPARIPLFSAGS